MPRQRKLPQNKRSVKRLLDDILPKKSAKLKVATSSQEGVAEVTPFGHSTDTVDICSSSELKTYEEVRKCDQSTSPDPTLPQSQRPSSSGQRPQGEQAAPATIDGVR